MHIGTAFFARVAIPSPPHHCFLPARPSAPLSTMHPLHDAVREADLQTVQALLRMNSALALDVDADGCLPLHLLGARDAENDVARPQLAHIARLLLEAAPGTARAQDARHGRTPLHYAASRRLVDTVRLLLREAPEVVGHADNDGNTPLAFMLTSRNPRRVGAYEATLALLSVPGQDPSRLLEVLLARGTRHDLPTFLRIHMPLPPGLWDRVPVSVGFAGDCLPAALVRGKPEDVRQVVRRMGGDSRQRLASVLGGLRSLPPELAQRIVARVWEDEGLVSLSLDDCISQLRAYYTVMNTN